MDVQNISWSVRQLISMSNKETLLFDYPIQRSGDQWDSLQQSYLIHTLAQKYPVPPIYLLGEKRTVTVMRKGEEVIDTIVVRWILDGIQRITTMKNYVEGLYPLHEDTPEAIIENEEFTLAGKYFSELDEVVQEMILSRSILTYTLDRDLVSDEEIEDLFFRMNNGSALTTQQKAKALIGVEWAKKLTEIGNHELISTVAAFSKTQIRSEGHLTAIVQTMMMLDGSFNYKNVSQRVISEYMETFKKDGPRKLELLEEVRTGMDYLLSVFSKKESLLLKKVHFPMTVMTAIKAIENNVDHESFLSWSVGFKEAFKATNDSITDVPTSYVEYTGKGSTDRYKADGRMVEMIRHMEEYTKVYGKEMIVSS